MSRLLVAQYHNEVAKIIQYSGSRNESSIRSAFQNLLNEYCKTRDFILVPELPYKSSKIRPDGTVKDALRLDWGFWESKDQYDNLDLEIEKKFNIGYPNDNILFEDSQTAVLIQGGNETLRIPMKDTDALDKILNAFINYIRPEVKDFRQGIEAFKADLPTILTALQDLITQQSQSNPQFIHSRDKFLGICQASINPTITIDDVSDMMMQHILTEDIFINIFNESQFHRENNIARELQTVIDTFFKGTTKRNTLSTIERYYAVIRRTAANIYNHHEKQKFLKAVYENFYKAYNPKAADRLGIVYTPSEIVKFTIESVDYLTHKHFGKILADPGVEILDPATGTGTFITELIEYLPKDKLKHKYKEEIHCNEVSILPYYIANLNIEFTYKQKMDEYEEFKNICFMDTLEHTSFAGKQTDLFSLSIENTERIKQQNDRDISVILGNPPYNAKQDNFNDNNANRRYTEVDKRIKDTYIKYGTAQNQIVVYDMYTRFLRWATDRLGKNGIVAFITNSSFINARTFDGFRKVVAEEFDRVYIIDLGGNVRANPKLSGNTHNVFGIQTGVAICFLVKQENNRLPCQIFYSRLEELDTAADKLKYLSGTNFDRVNCEHIIPDKKYNWINQSDNDFDSLLPLIDKDVKAGKSEEAIFTLFSRGVETTRDEWVYDYDEVNLIEKMQFFTSTYNNCVENREIDSAIKWSSSLESYHKNKLKAKFDKNLIQQSLYRPYLKLYHYTEKLFNHRLTQNHYEMYSNNLRSNNKVISISGIGSTKPFHCLGSNVLIGLDTIEKNQCIPLCIYDKEGNRLENITDWGLQQFQAHYQDKNINKENIFHYIYAVLHNTEYRSKYELNLKREFPRIPFYENFQQWANWGEQLIDLHINYETVEKYPFKFIEAPVENPAKLKPKLKADKEKGKITLDDATIVDDIPDIAWDYKLGNRSALEWILDQYKEKKPKDPTIAAKFNNYRFAEHKQSVIELLARVCTVSIETMKIVRQMQ